MTGQVGSEPGSRSAVGSGCGKDEAEAWAHVGTNCPGEVAYTCVE